MTPVIFTVLTISDDDDVMAVLTDQRDQILRELPADDAGTSQKACR